MSGHRTLSHLNDKVFGGWHRQPEARGAGQQFLVSIVESLTLDRLHIRRHHGPPTIFPKGTDTTIRLLKSQVAMILARELLLRLQPPVST